MHILEMPGAFERRDQRRRIACQACDAQRRAVHVHLGEIGRIGEGAGQRFDHHHCNRRRLLQGARPLGRRERGDGRFRRAAPDLALQRRNARSDFVAVAVRGCRTHEGPDVDDQRQTDRSDHQAGDHSACPRQVAVGRMGQARPQRDRSVIAVLACNDAIDPQPQGTELTACLVERRARGGEDLHIEDICVGAGGYLEAVGGLARPPWKQSLDLIAHDARQKIARLCRNGHRARNNIGGGKLENDERFLRGANDLVRQRDACRPRRGRRSRRFLRVFKNPFAADPGHFQPMPGAAPLLPAEPQPGEDVDPASHDH
ncbi:hypothetical protein chiPu_0028792, partial [Chiloscyllium punctatum]|nr:hypothetical protein [Chiloscyllium punctatum]